ncbi:Serine/threonine-protein phosphatase 4 regulatory subunit 2 [Gryllus bimaculatus]|nr:Serine/threonine-protein phosphatase 4 regulatory subunit 2 [Gryllus bimaculatus]
MVNPEEVLQSLDEFSKLKPKDIPRELEEYLMYVAKTGDPVYQWSVVKCLFREKMLNVITDFYESCPSIDLPPCPNVDPFNYETMKASLLERLESFSNAPFTVQRLCELLTTPRKEYTRVDKFMRAIEKNILVVSTKEPGGSRARPDAPPPQPPPSSQADVLMNGVMDGRGAGGLDIGEAVETVSSEGVNLMQAGADVALAETIRVECEDIEMDDAASAGVWDPKAGGERAADATASTATATAVVWDAKAEEECAVNGDGLKVMDTPVEGSTVVWDSKDGECGESLKALSPSPEAAPPAADPPAASKPAEDEHEAAAVAVVSEFLTPNREDFGQGGEMSTGVENVPLVLASGPDPEPQSGGAVSDIFFSTVFIWKEKVVATDYQVFKVFNFI